MKECRQAGQPGLPLRNSQSSTLGRGPASRPWGGLPPARKTPSAPSRERRRRYEWVCPTTEGCGALLEISRIHAAGVNQVIKRTTFIYPAAQPEVDVSARHQPFLDGKD